LHILFIIKKPALKGRLNQPYGAGMEIKKLILGSDFLFYD
jgi:hypothetical protein